MNEKEKEKLILIVIIFKNKRRKALKHINENSVFNIFMIFFFFFFNRKYKKDSFHFISFLIITLFVSLPLIQPFISQKAPKTILAHETNYRKASFSTKQEKERIIEKKKKKKKKKKK